MSPPATKAPKPIFGALSSITALFLLCLWAVDPRGNFPLSDDWAFAWAAKSICQEGRIDVLPWTGASMVLQAAWGALSCAVWGFSFETLRATTLVASLLTLLGTTLFLARQRVSQPAAVFVSAAILFNPLFFNLSFTFMTDLPFTALATLGTLAAALAAPAGPITAALLVGAATLVRQPGLVLSFALAAATLLGNHGQSADKAFGRIAIVSGPSILAFVGWSVWVAVSDKAPAAVSIKLAEALAINPLQVANVGFRAWLYLGLFLAPVTFAVGDPIEPKARNWAGIGALLTASIAAFLFWREGGLMPLLPNLLHDFALGAQTTRDALLLGQGPVLQLGLWFKLPLTLLSIVGCWRLLGVLLTLGPNFARGESRWFSCGALAIFAATFLQSAYYFDRYLLPVVVLSIIAIATAARRVEITKSAALTLGLFAFFSVAGTHDYMQWNRARHSLVETLIHEPGDWGRIDAGMDLNGWHNAASLGTWPSNADVRPDLTVRSKSWWWVVDDQRIIAFRNEPGYEVVDQRSWLSWLGGKQQALLALRRRDGDPLHPAAAQETPPTLVREGETR